MFSTSRVTWEQGVFCNLALQRQTAEAAYFAGGNYCYPVDDSPISDQLGNHRTGKFLQIAKLNFAITRSDIAYFAKWVENLCLYVDTMKH